MTDGESLQEQGEARREGNTYPNWYGSYQDHEGKWRKVKLYTDKGASQRRLNEIIREAENRAAGVITPLIENAHRPVSDHVTDYYASIAGLNADHQRIAKWTLDKLVEWGGWRRLADINEASMRTILAKLAAGGATVSYQNKFITRAKAFVNYLLAGGKIGCNPLASVKRGNVKRAKKTRARRPYEDGAIIGLLDNAPAHRSLAYAFGYLAGIRRNELRNLTWGDLRLNAPVPFIQLREEWTKGGKADALPLHPYLVRKLRELPAGDSGDKLVRAVPDMKTLVKDLKGIGYDLKDEKGRRTDFHALRHTLATNLSRTGCSETNKSAIMRHTDETVTDGYSHARLAELADCIGRLPAPAEQPQVAKMTGTDDVTTDGRWKNVGKTRVASGQPVALTGSIGGGSESACQRAQVRYDSAVGSVRQNVASGGSEKDDKLIIDKYLGPSTQVD